MTQAKQWSAQAIETALTAQGIALAPGRADKLARAQSSLLEAAAGDPLLDALEFDVDAPAFGRALLKCR